MTPPPALVRFMEARSDPSGRASDRAGVAYCEELAALLDATLTELAGPEPPFAVVAVGGSGRLEQCRHSDIDVMLLVPRGGERGNGEAARALYPLWDAQLKVGHSVRTIDQAISSAQENVETFTALLDARFVHGDRALYEQFTSAWRKQVASRRAWLRRELAALREERRTSEPWQLMAVDLKNSRGGLRDLQSIRWLAATGALASTGPVPALNAHLEAARERLLATRNAVHAAAERPSDVFRPENAAHVGRWLSVDHFEWARDLFAAMREVDAAVDAALAEPARRTRWPWSRRDQRAGAPSEAVPDDLEQLLDVLRAVEPAGPLEPLPPAPWLERLLPEWEVLRCRPHIAPFHVNPVDVHVLRCVAEARQVIEHDRDGTGTPEIAREFGRPDELLVAAFLHDIGKGHTGEHSAAGAVIAERFAVRAGLDGAIRHRLVTAVRQHLLLPAVATRRDIADEEVIRETAASVGDADTLRLLYLLAVADARASGPNVWSPWKAQLMRSLYRRVLAVLDAGGPGTIAPDVESAVEALADRFPAATVRAHLEGMGTDYLLSTPPATIGDHLEMIERKGAGAAVRHDRAGEVDRVTVVTGDRPGLLQAITGALAGHHASVLGGVAYTRTDGVAIQVWHVGDALNSRFDERRWERLLSALPAAIDGTYSIDERLAEIRASYPERARADVPTTIHLDNDASRAHTVLEVTAADRRGLLYAVTRALYEQGIDIHLAKVDTIGPEVVDSFYIRRGNGRRIEDPDEQERLRECIASAIEDLDR